MEAQDDERTRPERGGRTSSRHWRRASIAGATWWVLAVTALGVIGRPDNAGGLGYVAGRLMVPFLLATGVAGILAKRSDRDWSWIRHFLVTFLTGLVVTLVMALG